MARSARSPLWRHRDFIKLWGAETVSQFGTAVSLLAIPLVAINFLHASTGQVGALTAVEFSPFILVGLPAGVWVDRLRRRPVLLVGDVGRALVLASIPIAYALDALTIWQLYAVAFASGVLTVFFDVAYQSYLPSLVDRSHLADGNAKLEISRSAAQIAGPGIAGVLIAALSAPVAVTADALSYVLSAAAVVGIRHRESLDDQPAAKADRPRMRTQIGEGLRYVLGHRLLRPIALCTSTSNLFSSVNVAVVMLFMVRRLGFSASTIGLVVAAGNVGFLVGAATTSWFNRKLGLGRTIVLSIAISAPFQLLAPLAALGAAVPLLIASGVFGAFGIPVYNISQVSLRQAICPERLQGRMNASMRFMVWGTMPIGAALGGFLGARIGLTPTLWIGAAGQCLAWIPPAFSPVWKLRSIDEAEADETNLAAARDGAVAPSAVAVVAEPVASQPGE